jgi:hypothetical protein
MPTSVEGPYTHGKQPSHSCASQYGIRLVVLGADDQWMKRGQR